MVSVANASGGAGAIARLFSHNGQGARSHKRAATPMLLLESTEMRRLLSESISLCVCSPATFCSVLFCRGVNTQTQTYTKPHAMSTGMGAQPTEHAAAAASAPAASPPRASPRAGAKRHFDPRTHELMEGDAASAARAKKHKADEQPSQPPFVFTLPRAMVAAAAAAAASSRAAVAPVAPVAAAALAVAAAVAPVVVAAIAPSPPRARAAPLARRPSAPRCGRG